MKTKTPSEINEIGIRNIAWSTKICMIFPQIGRGDVNHW